MVEGKTKSGFNYKYDERILNDYGLLEAIGDFDASSQKIEQVTALKRIIDYLLGDNREAFLEHIASKNDGFRPLDVMQAEILEIINSSQQIKNS